VDAEKPLRDLRTYSQAVACAFFISPRGEERVYIYRSIHAAGVRVNASPFVLSHATECARVRTTHRDTCKLWHYVRCACKCVVDERAHLSVRLRCMLNRFCRDAAIPV